MQILYPKLPRSVWRPLALAVLGGSLAAGLYGVAHDQTIHNGSYLGGVAGTFVAIFLLMRHHED